MADVELRPLAPRDALEYFRSKGLAPALRRFDYRDIWQEEHARNFVVAKAMQDDILNMIRVELDRSFAEGRTMEQFQQDLAPRLIKAGWWGRSIERDTVTGELKDVRLGSMHRLKVIYDTNMRTAYAAGLWSRIQRSKDFLPYLEYHQIDRPSKRDEHNVFDGIILHVDHPIWRRIFPPNGWFCGCSTRPFNDRTLERAGKRLTTDAELAERIVHYQRLNRRSGQVEDAIEGLDPAFDSNPGHAWLDIVDPHAESRLDLPDTHMAADRALVQEIRSRGMRDGFESLLVYDLNDPAGSDPIGWARSDPDDDGSVMPTAAMWRAFADPLRRVVAIHNHPSSLPFSGDDFEVLLKSPGLHQLVAVGHDGSIYRMARTRATRPLDRQLANNAQATLILFMRDLVAKKRLSEADAGILHTHLVASILADLFKVDFVFAPSGRNRDFLTKHQGVIEYIIDNMDEVL